MTSKGKPTAHSVFIQSLIQDARAWGTYTRKELAEAASKECGYFVTSEQVRAVLRRFNAQKFTTEDNVKIGVDSSNTLKGGADMSTQSPTPKELQALEQHCTEHGLPFEDRLIWWHKTSQFSVCFKEDKAFASWLDQKAQLIEDVKKHAPKYKKRTTKPEGEHMLVLPMADIHIGKWLSIEETGKRYDTERAVKRAREGTDALVSKAKMFGVNAYVVCIGNDILHTENGKTTTAGTPQDNDGSWFMNFRAARDVYIGIIEQLALDADVYIIHVPSNHDWRSGYALSEVVAAHFAHHPNVKAQVTERHRKYVVYGLNLIMFSHGDGAKEKDLHWHLATETAEVWSQTTFRYVYLGHIHHKVRKVNGHNTSQIEKDKVGITEIVAGPYAQPTRDVNIEYVRSPSPADGWHDRNGYTNTPAMEAFLHHISQGQVARFTHFFKGT